jgi:hypothetical protein
MYLVNPWAYQFVVVYRMWEWDAEEDPDTAYQMSCVLGVTFFYTHTWREIYSATDDASFPPSFIIQSFNHHHSIVVAGVAVVALLFTHLARNPFRD